MNIPTVVVENGAHSIKAGVVQNHVDPRIITNTVVRSKGDKMTYIGHESDHCRDYSSLHYRLPFEKGYLVDWDAQEAIWQGLFSDEVLGVSASESSLVITEPYFNLPNIQDLYDQFVFEEHEFRSYHRCTPVSHISYGKLFSQPGFPNAECMIIVDCGFSFTHVIPILSGNIIWPAVRRLDIGGKLLTNHFKELISFRQWNMMDETFIMNQVKESCCFVSTNFGRDLETCRSSKDNPIVREYILPDLAINKKGHVREPDEMLTDSDQILTLGNERFSVPELIFCPSYIGMDQAGLADTIALSISQLPEDLQGMFWSNIGLVGGSTKFPGFAERLHSELRSLAPVDYEVVIYKSDDPILEAYRSLASFAKSSEYSKYIVTRLEYLESGVNAARRKFKDWKGAPIITNVDDEVEASRLGKDLNKGKGRTQEKTKVSDEKKAVRTKSRANVTAGASAKATKKR